MKYFLSLAFVALFSFYFGSNLAQAAGIQVNPSELDFKLSQKSATQEITVVNPTADVQVFDITADDFADQIKSNPESFTLEAGGRRTVKITVSSKILSAQSTVSTLLSVVATPLAAGKLQARTGVKIPLSISFGPVVWFETPAFVFSSLAAVLVLASGIFIYQKRKLKAKLN